MYFTPISYPLYGPPACCFWLVHMGLPVAQLAFTLSQHHHAEHLLESLPASRSQPNLEDSKIPVPRSKAGTAVLCGSLIFHEFPIVSVKSCGAFTRTRSMHVVESELNPELGQCQVCVLSRISPIHSRLGNDWFKPQAISMRPYAHGALRCTRPHDDE